MPSQFNIPDLLVSWPWPLKANHLLREVDHDADAWVQSFDLFTPKQFKKFKACKFNLLGSLVDPLGSKDHLRISCDLVSFYFAFDEYTDLANRDEAMKMARDVMDVFRNEEVEVPSQSKITDMAQQFFRRVVEVVGEDLPGIERFIVDFDAYTRSVIQEADDRVEGHVRSVEDYLILRRDTCGAKPSFSFLTLGLNISTEVFEHPLVISMVQDSVDLFAIINDMHSYGMEHSRGLDGHNIITAIMQEYHLNLQGALNWLSGYATMIITRFLSNREKLPSWGTTTDRAVRGYFDRVGRCIRGWDAWSYETKRYYGDNGLNVKKTRTITLAPCDPAYITKDQLRTNMMA